MRLLITVPAVNACINGGEEKTLQKFKYNIAPLVHEFFQWMAQMIDNSIQSLAIPRLAGSDAAQGSAR